MICVNCREREAVITFQGVLVCSDCFKIATHSVDRAKKELAQLMMVYLDMVRIALVKGELRPPVLPEERTMPLTEFKAGMRTVLERMKQDAKEAGQAKGEGEVPELRNDPHHSERAVQSGTGDPAVRRRRYLRSVPEVQEGGTSDHRDPGNADQEA
jgi:hypothetical protein